MCRWKAQILDVGFPEQLGALLEIYMERGHEMRPAPIPAMPAQDTTDLMKADHLK